MGFATSRQKVCSAVGARHRAESAPRRVSVPRAAPVGGGRASFAGDIGYGDFGEGQETFSAVSPMQARIHFPPPDDEAPAAGASAAAGGRASFAGDIGYGDFGEGDDASFAAVSPMNRGPKSHFPPDAEPRSPTVGETRDHTGKPGALGSAVGHAGDAEDEPLEVTGANPMGSRDAESAPPSLDVT